jgi:cell division protein FtsL
MKKAVRKFKETLEIRSSLWHRVRTHRFSPIILLLCAFLVAACIHIWQRVRVIQLAKDVGRLRAENVVLIDESKKIRSDIASLQMGSRIERYACDSLGLQPIAADRLFTLARKEAKASQADDLDLLATAINNISRHLPVVTGNEVNAGQVQFRGIDTASFKEEGQ